MKIYIGTLRKQLTIFRTLLFLQQFAIIDVFPGPKYGLYYTKFYLLLFRFTFTFSIEM